MNKKPCRCGRVEDMSPDDALIINGRVHTSFDNLISGCTSIQQYDIATLTAKLAQLKEDKAKLEERVGELEDVENLLTRTVLIVGALAGDSAQGCSESGDLLEDIAAKRGGVVMAWDIYGESLDRGHCEAHPHVHEEYPCSVCINESDRRSQQESAESQHYAAMEKEYYDQQIAELANSTGGAGI